MKIVLGYIMAFMVLAFSMLPCADDNSLATGEAGYELTQSAPQPGGGDHDDACSPFCICSCCAGFSVITNLPSTATVALPVQTTHFSYLSDRLYAISLPIWQPPQLV